MPTEFVILSKLPGADYSSTSILTRDYGTLAINLTGDSQPVFGNHSTASMGLLIERANLMRILVNSHVRGHLSGFANLQVFSLLPPTQQLLCPAPPPDDMAPGDYYMTQTTPQPS